MVAARLSAFLDACKRVFAASHGKACPLDNPKEKAMSEAWKRAIEADEAVKRASEKDGKPVVPPPALVAELAQADALFLALLREWEAVGVRRRRP